MRRLLTLGLATAALFTHTLLRAQSGTRYAYPVRDVPGLCAANFGEIRPGHFHAGVDIKTDGAEGKPLVAVADGWLSRAVIAPYGYGRALYLTLPDGTTAVYGHLQRFRDDLEAVLRDERYRRRANNLDLTFDAGRWPVKRGDVIGYSGNSGSSGGPHLHFELREAGSGRRLNLVRAGIIRPKDDLPPRIMRIHWIDVDTVQGIPLHGRPESYAVVRQAEGRYRLTREEPVPVGRKGYFVAEVTDRRNDVHNTFGIWRLTASVDGTPYFEYRMDGFTYDLSRCCDAVSCYPLQLGSRNEVLRLAQLEGAPGCFYTVMEDRGVLRTAAGEKRRIRIEVEDDSGNRSSLEFTVCGRSDRPAPPAFAPESRILRRDRTSTAAVGSEAGAHIPAGALYEDCAVRPDRCPRPEVPAGVAVLSPSYRLLGSDTPLRQAATVLIRCDVPRPLQLRTMLAVRSSKGKLTPAGGAYAGGVVTAQTRTLDGVTVVADTLPPAIRPRFAEGANLAQASSLRFSVSDNFSGVTACTLHIDGRWVPCDRLPMQGLLFHTFDTPPARSRHRVQLTVRDAAGNTAGWEGTFYR